MLQSLNHVEHQDMTGNLDRFLRRGCYFIWFMAQLF